MLQHSIAIGVIFNQHDQVLIAKRQHDKHLAGYWEFPGGKLMPGESFKTALRRELIEEVGITPHTVTKFFATQYQYTDRNLTFQCFKVTNYSGDVHLNAHQSRRWVSLSELANVAFPAANRAIIDALTLPVHYVIADEYVLGAKLFSSVESQLKSGARLIQHRAGNIDESGYVANSHRLKYLCSEYGAKYLANCPLDWLPRVKPSGVHLNSHSLKEVFEGNRQIYDFELYSAACHNEKDISMANQLGLRCLLIGPVNFTMSHPDANKIGWKGFNQLCSCANVPVYALGGMCVNDYRTAVMHGGQGIAAIRAFMI